MKKLLITAVLAAMPFLVSAQTTAFDKFENVEGIETVVINKKMFEMIGNVDMSSEGEAQKFMDMAKGLEYVKVFTTSEKKHRKEMAATVAGYLKSNPLEELMSIKDEKTNVKIYVNKGDSSIVKECLVFVDDDKEMVLLSLTGNIDLKSLGDLKGLKKK